MQTPAGQKGRSIMNAFGRNLMIATSVALFGGGLFAPASSVFAQADKAANTVEVKVTDTGFEPARITVKKDTPVHLTFLRTSDKTCATEVLIPDQNIKKDLPLNKGVTVDLMFKKDGEVTFMCGQKMMKGTIVVQPS
jgi:plastocyanin domain-containing protein